MVDFYMEAAESFEQHLRWIEDPGRRDSPDWHLANGLLDWRKDYDTITMRKKTGESRPRDPGCDSVKDDSAPEVRQ